MDKRHHSAEPIDSFRIEHIALKALENASLISAAEIQKMAASIIAHIHADAEDTKYLQYAFSRQNQPHRPR